MQREVGSWSVLQSSVSPTASDWLLYSIRTYTPLTLPWTIPHCRLRHPSSPSTCQPPVTIMRSQDEVVISDSNQTQPPEGEAQVPPSQPILAPKSPVPVIPVQAPTSSVGANRPLGQAKQSASGPSASASTTTPGDAAVGDPPKGDAGQAPAEKGKEEAAASVEGADTTEQVLYDHMPSGSHSKLT